MAAVILRTTTASCWQLQKLLHITRKPWGIIPSASTFWESDRKGGYNTKMHIRPTEKLKLGLGLLKQEVGVWKEETKEKFRCDSMFFSEPGDYEVLWKFDSQEVIDQWLITTDKDHNEGKSHGELVLGPNKKVFFQGSLDTDVPKDGIVKRAGYCNMRSPVNFKSFKREIAYDWSRYTHLLVRVRGDGRIYQLFLNMERYYDIQWNDLYTFPLFTRGGPYWQTAKIPFSKFILSSKGRVQDKQERIQLQKIRFLSLTIGDANPGPFQLEIDYIGLLYDPSHREEFAYEMYKCSPHAFS